MQPQFWLDRWANDNIGFHRTQVHPLLIKCFEVLNLAKSSVVFVPLCGKTLDIQWIMAQGHHVVGVELSQKAIEALFETLELTPTRTPIQQGIHYQAPQLEIFVGDIFDLAMHLPQTIDVIYDRAAFVALPPSIRKRYAQLLTTLTQVPHLLIGREGICGNPPFLVDKDVLHNHYGNHYAFTALDRIQSSTDAWEVAWHLQPKNTP